MDSPKAGDITAEHQGEAGSAQQASTWPKIMTDYHGALVRLATMRAARKQYLLLGYVELFPRDIPIPERFTSGEKPWTVPNVGGDVTLRRRLRRCPLQRPSLGTGGEPGAGDNPPDLATD